MKNLKTLVLTFLAIILIISCKKATENQEVSIEKTQTTADEQTSASKIEVIQFHSEHRCMTCNKIEALTIETLKSSSDIHFKLVNVDDPKNEAFAADFEAFGTALFLYDSEKKTKKELTELAFMNAGNQEKFISDLKSEIEKFSR
jgi:uncharacterized protein involved in high-affinity Fe2+ transport